MKAAQILSILDQFTQESHPEALASTPNGDALETCSKEQMIQICADEGIDLQVLAKRARAQESEWPALVHYVIVEGKKPKKRKEPVEELSQEYETQENKKKKTEDTPPAVSLYYIMSTD